nr:hypothetical protein [Tanacetum cinerariifolium]
MERLVAFPFANSCVSASSVAVCVQHGRKSKEDHDSSSHMVYRSYDMPKDQKDEDGRTTSIDNIMKNSFRFLAPSKPNVSIRLQRLTKTIKCLSQSLVFKENMDDGQTEMEIGLPTDVKHVAHVGFDGSVTSEAILHGNQTTSDILDKCIMIQRVFLRKNDESCCRASGLHERNSLLGLSIIDFGSDRIKKLD